MKTVVGWMGSHVLVDDSYTNTPSHMRVYIMDDGTMKAASAEEHSELSAKEKASNGESQKG